MLDTPPPATSINKSKSDISLGLFILGKFSIFSIFVLGKFLSWIKIVLGKNVVLGKKMSLPASYLFLRTFGIFQVILDF